MRYSALPRARESLVRKRRLTSSRLSGLSISTTNVRLHQTASCCTKRRGVSCAVASTIAVVRIRAAVLEEFGQPLAVQEVELDEPRAGEALVRLAACGVCHTDLYAASGADPTGYAPCVLGHEGAGVVERVGEGGRGLVPPGGPVA